ncbi:helix-turn-helix domain-containing protein [Actinokineospora sp. HUAS TT18]|uniref:helix-turn-helix domain-containing protein n=1 Tax=Actinokineospora sp. HUAS TT18 TaxID=3447451 RepID=UPI003F520C0C
MHAKSRAGGRELGDLLRYHREMAGLTMEDLSGRFGRSITLIHRLEKGERRTITETEVVHFLVACGATYQEVNEAVAFWRETVDDRGYRLCKSGHLMSDSLRSLIHHEAKADRVVNYQPEVIPGLLQTEPYIQALFRRSDFPEDKRQERVTARLNRQKILFRNNPGRFTYFINERALRLEVGNYKVMAEQLLAMLFFADRENISLRVIPAAARHHALFGAPFMFLDYEQFSPIIYLEHALGGTLAEDRAYIEGYRALLRQVVTVAFNERDSRAFIAKLADEYDRAEGHWDDSWRVAKEQL